MATTSVNIDSFSDNIQQLFSRMNPCILCPRECKVNRLEGQAGFCHIENIPVVSSIGPHFGEEKVLVGAGGSGTIFFAGCNLACVFCQNYDISHNLIGQNMPIEDLVESMLSLQHISCSNINLVTPTHVIAFIAAALEIAKQKGLTIPVVYNSGGYDAVDTLKLLNGMIDIYMPDMKYSEPKVAQQLSNAVDYPQINHSAVKEMHRQVGNLQLEKGLATKGLLIRHLVLPNEMADSYKTIDFISEEISKNTAINIMDQYHPCFNASEYSKINRKPTREEFLSVRQYAIDKGLNVKITDY